MLVRFAATLTFVLGGSVAGATCTVRSVLPAGSSEFGEALPEPDGWLGSPPHVFTGEALLRGIGPPMKKTVKLLFVSMQPLPRRGAAGGLGSDGVGCASEQLAAP